MQRADTIAFWRGLGVAVVTIGLIAGCEPIRKTHGYMPAEAYIASVQIGQDTRADVQSKLGRPSSSAAFEDDEWYYVSRSTKTVAFYAPTVEDQKVLVVGFDAAGVVKDINRYGLQDGKVIDLVLRTTPTRGKRLTFIQQLIGNVGRLDSEMLTNR